MSSKRSTLIERLRELEERVRELEAAPRQIVPVPVVVPTWPTYTWPTYTFTSWGGTVSQSVSSGAVVMASGHGQTTA